MARRGKDLREDRRWYVYALCDPRDDSVRYVGQTVDHDRRYAEHVSGQLPHYGGPKQDHPVRKWIRSLQAIDENPRMRILAVVSSQKDAYLKESEFRRQHKRTAINGRAWWTPIPPDHVALAVAFRLLHVGRAEFLAICEMLGIRPRTVQYRSMVAFTIISHAEIETIRTSAVYRRRHARASGWAGPEPSPDC